jgi:hypothetical protein
LNYPAVYTRVASYLDWIQGKTGIRIEWMIWKLLLCMICIWIKRISQVFPLKDALSFCWSRLKETSTAKISAFIEN